MKAYDYKKKTEEEAETKPKTTFWQKVVRFKWTITIVSGILTSIAAAVTIWTTLGG